MAISAWRIWCSIRPSRAWSVCSTGNCRHWAILLSTSRSTARPCAWHRTRTEACLGCRSTSWESRASVIISIAIMNARARPSGWRCSTRSLRCSAALSEARAWRRVAISATTCCPTPRACLRNARNGIDRERAMSIAEPMMNVDEAIRLRRSVRGFLPREVPEATLREVFALAQFAPSNCNVQPWNPHVVSGDRLKRLREALVAAGMRDDPIRPDWPADGKFTGIYRERQVGAAQALYGAMGVARSDAAGRKLAYIRNHAFFDAPHAVFIFMPEPFDTREATDI